MAAFLKGLVIGFSIAAPVGPIGLLCIRRSLNEGRLAGFVTGLGAATADGVYGVVAAFGVTALMHALVQAQGWLQLGGGIFLLYLGVATLRRWPAAEAAPAKNAANLLGAYASTFVLTLTNPMTILSFIAIFAGLGVGAASAETSSALPLVAGVFLGSCAWWLILSTSASWLGGRLQQNGLRALNLAAGLIIAGFGVWQLARVL